MLYDIIGGGRRDVKPGGGKAGWRAGCAAGGFPLTFGAGYGVRGRAADRQFQIRIAEEHYV